VRVSPAWLRAGGIAAAGAAVIACSATAAVGGTSSSSSARRATPRPAILKATGAASSSAATAGASRPGGTDPASGSVAAPALSTKQLAGQRVIFSYKGLTVPSRLLSLIRHGDAAGVIFFGGNISSRAQITKVIKQLEQADAAPTNPVRTPLLLMTDQEGGLVRRLPGAPDQSEKQIGAAAHPAAAARDAGTGAAANLRGVGMNLNLAPVLDVYRTAGDFDDQFQRSYSKSPHKVSYLGADFIKAQQAGGVAATAKHVPGLGAATRHQDTDLAPVTLNVSTASLRSIDEYPYQAAIAAKVKLVMVSWARYPALAPRPAGLSSTIVRGELRDRLGFGGVTITDALEAGALKAYGSTEHRALLAAQAGMDLVLCSAQDVGQGVQCLDGLQSGYASGSLGKAMFLRAETRVQNLRASLKP
jgi:beta-N-acetylhexosaminidase